MELIKGQCNMEHLKLNVETIGREFQLPFEIISGYIQELSINIPWNRFQIIPFVNVKIFGNAN